MLSWCNLRLAYFNHYNTLSVLVGRAMWNSRKIAHYMSRCIKSKNDPFKNFCRREVRMLIKKNANFGAKNSCIKNQLCGRWNESIEK
jgi:hypothetical protein